MQRLLHKGMHLSPQKIEDYTNTRFPLVEYIALEDQPILFSLLLGPKTRPNRLGLKTKDQALLFVAQPKVRQRESLGKSIFFTSEQPILSNKTGQTRKHAKRRKASSSSGIRDLGSSGFPSRSRRKKKTTSKHRTGLQDRKRILWVCVQSNFPFPFPCNYQKREARVELGSLNSLS